MKMKQFLTPIVLSTLLGAVAFSVTMLSVKHAKASPVPLCCRMPGTQIKVIPTFCPDTGPQMLGGVSGPYCTNATFVCGCPVLSN